MAKSPAEAQTEILALRLKQSVTADLAEINEYVGANNPTELVRGWVLDRILGIHNTSAFRKWQSERADQKKRHDPSQGALP